jgi:hypothetical protein
MIYQGTLKGHAMIMALRTFSRQDCDEVPEGAEGRLGCVVVGHQTERGEQIRIAGTGVAQ